MMSPASVNANFGLERAIAESARAAAAASFGYADRDAAGRATTGLRADQRVVTPEEVARANVAGRSTGRKFRKGDKMVGTLLDIKI
jgi:hypothetical protein